MKKTLLSLLVFLAALSSARAQEEDVAAFFKGKTRRCCSRPVCASIR